MINDKTMQRIKQILLEDEGLYIKKYKCSKGIDTIGIGFAETFGFPNAIKTITGVNSFKELDAITEEQALSILEYQVRYFEDKINNAFDWYKYKSQSTKVVIINIVFNIGLSGFSKFKNTINALERDDMMSASRELLDSSYFSDVKGRALKNAITLLTQDIYIDKDDTDLLYKVIEKRL